jgi:putative ABC transport system permease protein
MLVLGAVGGLGLGVASERYIESLLYVVRATDLTMLLVPVLALMTVAVLASFPPAIRAVRTDPVTTIHVE